MKGNKAGSEQLVVRIMELMNPIRNALEAQKAKDIDHRLKDDLGRFHQYVPTNVTVFSR
jgi:dynactin complex subunit